MPNVFVDTNILVYAAAEFTPTQRKTTIARELLLLPGIHFSVQVLNEFIAVSRRPDKLNLPPDRERRWLEAWLLHPVASLSTRTFLTALSIHGRYGISHWDSLIVASATETDCATLYSEDLSHGQNYAGVSVVNPFL
jgi:predicted nucleic acid-binding protein